MSIDRDGVSHFLGTEPIHLAVQFSLFPIQNSRTPQYSLGSENFLNAVEGLRTTDRKQGG